MNLRKSVALFRRTRKRRRDGSLPGVTGVQWTLAGLCLLMALWSYEVHDYVRLALLSQALVVVSLLLLLIVIREVLESRCIGKVCLIGSTFVFFWIDLLSLTWQRLPFAVPEGFPLKETQFSFDLIREALLYVSVFQLVLLIGYSLRPRLERPLQLISARTDSLSFDRTLVAILLITCGLVPMLFYYQFDVDRVTAALLASRSGTEFEAGEPGVAQHLALFGIFGGALFFVYALKVKTWRRLAWILLGVLSALPFVSAGTRHVWLYISLPSLLVLLRGFKGRFTPARVFAVIIATLFILTIAQFQIAYRTVGWREIGSGPTQELLSVNTNGHFTALLFAEHLVPDEHPYFRQPSEFYFLIHWIPRQLWPSKPIMESWLYYNDSYVQGANFNVTPSVIGQFHMDWGLAGVIYIGACLGFLAMLADRVLLRLDSDRQRATFVVLGMFYAFIISSFRFYSPIYFSYFVFGVIAMFLLTRRRSRVMERLSPVPHSAPAQA